MKGMLFTMRPAAAQGPVVPIASIASIASIATLIFAALMLAACGGSEDEGADVARGEPSATHVTQLDRAGAAERTPTYYQCPMHPHIIREKPGMCPICGMDLVPVEEEAMHGSGSGEATDMEMPEVRIEPAVIQKLGVRVEPVERRTLSSEIRLDGRVTVDERRVRSIPVRMSGYVEVLRADETGKVVRKGETLFELYSPELVTAQEEFLQATRAEGGASGIAALSGEPARERLLNWGISESYIASLGKTGKVRRRVPITSPSDGVILAKSVVEGQAVSPGMELFRIADLSRVWVTARVYQRDLARLSIGAHAVVRLNDMPGAEFKARLDFIAPTLDPATRTAEIRIHLSNGPDMKLRPEMLAVVAVQDTASGEVLAVPSQSLIRTGRRDVAIVALGGGRFQPREVKVGREAEGWIEIRDGLEEGEMLATSAQFLIDAESNLRASLRRMQDGTSSGGGHAH